MSEQIFEYRIRAFLILFFLLPQMIVNFIQDEYRSSFMSIIVERKWHICAMSRLRRLSHSEFLFLGLVQKSAECSGEGI